MGKRKRERLRPPVPPEVLGKRDWLRLHSEARTPLLPAFRSYGWSWQPAPCRCKQAHILDTSEATKQGRT